MSSVYRKARPTPLDAVDVPIAVMGETGTTSDLRDALFVGTTYGLDGITVAVRIGFDDNRALGANEAGLHAALPIFREIMLRVYRDGLVAPVPRFLGEIDARIDTYVATRAAPETAPGGTLEAGLIRSCRDLAGRLHGRPAARRRPRPRGRREGESNRALDDSG